MNPDANRLRALILGGRMHPSITEDRVCEILAGSQTTGLCHACGAEQGETEPDAVGYPCEACGEEAVHGAEETLLMLG